MASDSDFKDSSLTTIFMVAIITTIIFIVIISFLGLKINKVESCGGETFSDYSGKALMNSSQVIDDKDVIVLQEITVSDLAANIEYTFCYDLIASTDDGVKVLIVNDNNTVLGMNFVSNRTIDYCAPVNNDFKRTNFIGLSCPLCNSSHNLTIQKEAGGTFTNQYNLNDGVLKISNDNTLSYELTTGKNCKPLIKTMINLYLMILIMLFIITAIVIGYEKMKQEFLEDWDGV